MYDERVLGQKIEHTSFTAKPNTFLGTFRRKKKTQNKINIAACRLDVYVTGNIIKKKKK